MAVAVLVFQAPPQSTAQPTALGELQCDRGQGYLFARPLPSGELEDLLTRPAVPPQPAAAGAAGP